jgi:transcriptional regulator with XRE-family HTH domain
MKTDNTFPLTLGEQLLIARRRAGYSMSEVAHEMRIVVGTLRNWESDRTIPRDRDLLAVCELLDLDPEALSPGIRSRCSADRRNRRAV